MKNHLVDYVLEYQKISFSKCPLSEVDFLVLCQLAYIKFDGIIPSIDEEFDRGMTLWEINKRADRERLFVDQKYRPENEALYDAMLLSKRYEGLKYYYYEDRVDDALQMQFSALTVEVDPKTYIVVYRGTDEYFVSWKEDFNLSFWEKVPGQVRALEYLQAVGQKKPGKLYVCGHSKGGNFATYASMCVEKEIQDRIDSIYNFDGPGFRKEVLEEKEYDKIASRVHKVIPKSSMVGMLLGEKEECKVVDSSALGIMQHNLNSWIIKNGKFKTMDKIFESTRYMDERINAWISGLSVEERKIFTNTIFDVAAASETNNLRDLTFDKEGIKKASQVMNAAKKLDPQTKSKMQEIMKELIRVTMEPVFHTIEMPSFTSGFKKTKTI